MPRFKLTIEYDGTRYSGWQLQKGGRSVQGEIIDACRDLFGTDSIDVYGAGRTDSGVHAIGQVAHLEASTGLLPLMIRYRINDRLPHDISILDVEKVPDGFHARHDAAARSYIYQISRRRTSFGKKYVWWIKDQLDIGRMNDAANHFTGLRNYMSFTDAEQEQKSTRVEIMHSKVYDFGDMLLFHVIGSHFLWKQVRRMTGVVVEAGRGKLDPRDIPGFFRNHSDVPAALTSPPSGLFLEKVYYPGEKICFTARPVMNL